MKRISAVLMLLTVALSARPARAAQAEWSAGIDVSGLSRKAQALKAKRQKASAEAPAAPAPEALPEPYAAVGFDKFKSDDKAAFAQLAKTCAESGNDSSLVGQRFQFRDSQSKQDVAVQICAPQGKSVSGGRSYVLLFAGSDAQSPGNAAKSLKSLCAAQGSDAVIVGEWYDFVQAKTAVSAGVCRYRLPK